MDLCGDFMQFLLQRCLPTKKIMQNYIAYHSSNFQPSGTRQALATSCNLTWFLHKELRPMFTCFFIANLFGGFLK